MPEKPILQSVPCGGTVELRKSFGPLDFAPIRVHLTIERGWVIERQLLRSQEWVEWCAIPRLTHLDVRIDDEDAFVEEGYAHHESDAGEWELPSHVRDERRLRESRNP